LANQATLKAKYTDGNGNVRPGWDYYSVQAVLRAADNEALYAWDSLNRATSERNAAQSRAAQEFKAASEQFARAERERQAREDQRRREYQRELQSDRRGDRGGR
jgi:hypothetical protein